MWNFRKWWRNRLVGASVVAAALLIAGVASAQTYGERPYNDRPYNDRPYNDRPAYGDRSGYGDRDRPAYNERDRRCQDLERQLVSDWQTSNNPRDMTANLDQQIAEWDRARVRAEGEAEQRACYEDMFLFGRSLRRNPPCIRLNDEIENARRNVTNLRQQRDALTNSASRRMRRDDLVAELARNGCGENYAREYESRRRSQSIFSLWDDEDSGGFDRRDANPLPQSNNLPFASYRTMCVRLCDGYYFPVSYSTLSSRFQDDEAKCREQCAAPAELYVYKNPGEEVENMVSLNGKQYTSLKTAFLNRKHYIKGCSCKPDEYSEEEIAKSEQAIGKQASSRPLETQSAEKGARNP